MPTVTVFAPELTGLSPTLWLTVRGTGVLTNADGDALTELANGTFEATVAESINVAHDAAIKISGNTVRTGVLLPNDTVIRDCYELTGDQATRLNQIWSQTQQISGARITTAGPVTAGGEITLICTKDYKVAAESSLSRSISDPGGGLHTVLTDETLSASLQFGAGRQGTANQITGTISSLTYANDVLSFEIEIDGDEIPSTLPAASDYEYQIQRTTAAGDEVVVIDGSLTLRRRRV